MINRAAAIAACVLALLAATPKPHRGPAHKAGKQVLPIALVLDGTKMGVEPPPVFYRDHLLVPVRRILSALGLAFQKQGPQVRTYAGAKTITLTIGSTRATVDDQTVDLDAPPVEIDNTLYAPLRFFTQALGAQAVFERQTNSVEITSTLLGQTGSGIVNAGGGVQEMGTLTAIDLDSDPPTLTLTYGASARTLQITPDVTVIVQDVNTGTSNSGDLEALHPGDYAQLRLDRGGRVKQIVDAYGSRTGTVAAVGSGQLVLNDGHVITPVRTTAISLNGSSASVDQIDVGDQVMVRYNIDSSQAREIIATRASTGSPAPSTGIAIQSISLDPARPLRENDVLSVTMKATPGGTASYDIGPYVRSLPLTESAPGSYTGTYKVPRGVNFSDAPVFGHLNVRGSDAPEAESQTTVSVATEPPGIIDFAPDSGVTVNNSRPSIYATFSAGTVQINASSERIEVNGHDLTSSAMRTERFLHYTPGIDFPDGPMRVTVSVADAAGNVASRSWTFFIKR